MTSCGAWWAGHSAGHATAALPQHCVPGRVGGAAALPANKLRPVRAQRSRHMLWAARQAEERRPTQLSSEQALLPADSVHSPYLCLLSLSCSLSFRNLGPLTFNMC